MKKGHLELVEWLDSVTSNGWQRDGEKEHHPAPCVSVGWIVQETKKALSLAPNVALLPGTYEMDFDDQYGDVTTIPKGMITKRRKIKL